MPNKQNNRRVYPDANRQPRHKARFRIEEAKERQEAYDKLTLVEKLAQLAPEPHCAKQRARLQALLVKQSAPKEKSVAKENPQASATEAAPKAPKPKKYMKQ